MVGIVVLIVTLVAAAVVGLVLRRRDGRFRSRPVPAPAPTRASASPTGRAPVEAGPEAGLSGELDALGVVAGERATLLQFSSAFCAPCRATRRILADVAATVPGVTHADVDAEAHLDVVRRLGVRRTPTVFVLGPDTRVVSRASGAPPSRDAVYAAVGAAVGVDGGAAGGVDGGPVGPDRTTG